MKRTAVILLLIFAVALPYVGLWYMHKWYEHRMSAQDRASFIIADKQTMTLSVIDHDGSCVASFPMGCGKAYGTKIEKGDNRTPEGVFRISDIQDSKNWKHDFGDGEGEIAGAYGPWFIRLSTEPHKGIGIHGTHVPQSLGTRCTEGCIRLSNENIARLKEYAYCGLTVIILPSEQDIIANKK
jgi:Uncharacterized protein conserved in bacteria